MNFREQLKDPTEAMRTLFDTGLVVMEGDENITDSLKTKNDPDKAFSIYFLLKSVPTKVLSLIEESINDAE